MVIAAQGIDEYPLAVGMWFVYTFVNIFGIAIPILDKKHLYFLKRSYWHYAES